MSKKTNSIIGKTILVAALLGLFGSGCAYYNTFFLARKNYRLAEKSRLRSASETLPGDAKAKYDIAITKSSRVLAFYPESKWVDDALFLLGMCFYRTGEYAQAVRKFDELSEAFPESQYIAEASYWRTLCIYELGEFDAALEQLRDLSEAGTFAERSTFMMAELLYQQEDYIGAKDAYMSYIEAYPRGQYRSLARYRLATIEFVHENYVKCIEQVRQIVEKELTPAEFFGSRMLIGEALTELDSLDSALEHYSRLRKEDAFYTRWPEVDLRIGDVHYLLDDTTSAIEIWRDVCLYHPRTENAAWGWFKRGDLHLDFSEFAVAKMEFDSSAAQVSTGRVRELALQKSASIARLTEFQNLRDSSHDTLDIDVAGTGVALAEMYLLDLNMPDSALSEYNFVLKNYPNDSLAPKSAYGIGWIYAHQKRNRDKADSAFAELLKQYPESDYAVGAADYFVGRGAALDSLGVQTVAFYFVKAEEFLLTHNRIDSALAYYRLVADEYPKSQFRPKAIAAMAYIHEYKTFNYQMAESLYTFIADSLSGSEFSELAEVRLGRAAPKFETERPPEFDEVAEAEEHPEERPQQRMGQSRDMDIRPTQGGVIDPATGREMPRAPRPRFPVELRYPEAEWSSRLEGRVVRLKIRIDVFGKVEETEILATCGSDIIDQAAIRGVENNEWDTEEIPLEYLGDWFYYEVRVQKPALTIDSPR
ncbi:MAG TPA: tetratricopeptide repeat protein [candidate division Zixibacteria bacterium]|nr:tetratricopeptide repeat protein [candidate division Zixibacteria bacterium]